MGLGASRPVLEARHTSHLRKGLAAVAHVARELRLFTNLRGGGARPRHEWGSTQMGHLVPDVVAAREGCDVQASGDGGENNDHPGHDACVLEPEESRHEDLELHSSASRPEGARAEKNGGGENQ
eukprot:scaffold63076_cov48-Phaeocystis_antarctica.AAC.1